MSRGIRPGLAIIAGALDPRVKAIGVVHAAMADQFGYFQGRPAHGARLLHVGLQRQHGAAHVVVRDVLTAPKRDALDAFLFDALGVTTP